jgi:hypothetical protein
MENDFGNKIELNLGFPAIFHRNLKAAIGSSKKTYFGMQKCEVLAIFSKFTNFCKNPGISAILAGVSVTG